MVWKFGSIRLHYTFSSGNSLLSVSEVVGRIRRHRGQAGKPTECSPETPTLLSALARPFSTSPTPFVFLPSTGFPFTLKIMKAGKGRMHAIKCV